MEPIVIQVNCLVFQVDSLSPDKLQIDYSPDTLELVMSIPVGKQLTISVPESQQPPVTLAVGTVQLRFSEEVARYLAEQLPPELLH